jgi:hypothetical protein
VVNVYGDYEEVATLRSVEEVNDFMKNAARDLLPLLNNSKKNKAKIPVKKLRKAKTAKPSLPMSFVTYHVVDYSKLNEFVKQVYGIKNYSFLDDEQVHNDSCYDFKITGKHEWYSDEEVEEARQGKNNNNNILLEALCADGYIPSGHYLVTVCW